MRGNSEKTLQAEQAVEIALGSGASRRLNGFLIKSTAVAALGGLLFGFDTAVIAGATADLTSAYHLSPGYLGLTVSIALWGTVVGAISAGIPGDRYGRRDSLRALAALYLISALGCGFAWSWLSLVVFRFIEGIAIGGSSVLGPMYIAEIAPAKWRGRLVAFFQLNVVFGILLAYFSNYLIGLQHFGAIEWRWMLGVSAVPAALFVVMLYAIPRSPRWLAKKRRLEEAEEVLRLVGEPNPDEALKSIVTSIDLEHSSRDRLFSRRYRLPIFLAVTVAMFNQMAGINAILYYLNDIFSSAGYSKVSADLQSVVIGATFLVFTVIAMTVIDKIGRKKLLLIGAVGTCACLSGIAAIFFTGSHRGILLWLLIAYIAFFAFSQGTVIWVYISEVFPNQVRAKGQSLGSFSHWSTNAVIAGVFPLMAASSGGFPFAFFAAMTLLQFFVVLFIYPETKGVSLEDMERKLGTL